MVISVVFTLLDPFVSVGGYSIDMIEEVIDKLGDIHHLGNDVSGHAVNDGGAVVGSSEIDVCVVSAGDRGEGDAKSAVFYDGLLVR